ncbi:hypothetical protein CBL_12507 [Carabus blaptoides fortunei]
MTGLSSVRSGGHQSPVTCIRSMAGVPYVSYPVPGPIQQALPPPRIVTVPPLSCTVQAVTLSYRTTPNPHVPGSYYHFTNHAPESGAPRSPESRILVPNTNRIPARTPLAV